jgi:3-hydroxyacyl-CoA dehydrogenase/enoyl-CoA hydratase/3-hydroxybutyryl-CoA epimerase
VSAAIEQTAAGRRALSHELDPEGILVVTLDVPGEKVNALSRSLLGEFLALMDGLESRDDVTGVILRSGKTDNFIAGADIRDFGTIRSQIEGETLAREGQALLDRMEGLPMPVVAAIHGSCLGGGLETALACRYRILTDDPKSVVGLPEVMLGLIPGGGGTQRLPRLIGIVAALDLILTGRTLKPRRALKAGVVDEVVPAPVLLQAARDAVRGLAAGTLKARAGGIPLREKLLRPLIFRKALSSVMAKGGRHYPAPLKAVEVVRAGTATSMAEGLKIEARAFGELAVSDVSRALVSVFFATQEIKKDAGYPEGTTAREVGKLAVLGAGLMGAGIAGAGADAGARVRLRDTSDDALGRALRHARELLDERRRKGSLTRLDVEKKMDLLSVTTDYGGFRRADLVIEAVFEDIDLKRSVLAEVEAATGEECVFASNTSSLPISDIARDARRPSRVLGMHFFSPVHKMPLLEVIVTEQTDAWATATAVTFGRRLGKHVIVVRDGPGFFTTRALAPYLNEAARMLEEGVAVETIDRAMTDFGFPVGPITLMDEVGIDVGAKVARILHDAFGERLTPPESMLRVVEDGRQGRKNRKGFYVYDGHKKDKKVDAGIYMLLGVGQPRRDVDPREIQERLVFQFLNESALCLQEGILRSPRDGDVGAIFGLGFPPFLGGPFRYLDHLGARFAVEVLERLRSRHGDRFTPARLLQDMAREGRSFH